MDNRIFIYFLVSLVLISTESNEEPMCGSACAPKFEHDYKVLQKLAQLETNQKSLEETINSQQKQIITQQNVIEDLRKTLSVKSPDGATYIRWGRTTCPGNGTELIYKGFMVGNKWNEYGGGANHLCLPDDPTWKGYVDGYNGAAEIYGTEIEVESSVSNKLFGKQTNNQDIPCAMCKSSRAFNVMFPARANCYPGWTEEYSGYLVAPNGGWKANSDYVCLDSGLEFVIHGSGNDNEHVLNVVEVRCGSGGSLPCPPFTDGRELACVVCSA